MTADEPQPLSGAPAWPLPGDSAEAQHGRYMQGHRRNPLTSTPLGARVLSATQLLWFLLLPPRGFAVLVTRGRKSGRPRRRCVRVASHGRTVYLVSLRGPHAAWMHNVRACPRVRLRLRGGWAHGTARPLTGPAEVAIARERYGDTVHALDWLEYPLHRPGRPTRERIRALHHHWFTIGTPVAIDLAGGAPGQGS